MNLFENVSWEEVAANLREQADAQSGAKGALIGAGLGVVMTVAAMRATGRKPTVALLLTGAAVGIAYGAADKKVIRGD
jgi:hypothetical protein